MTKKAFNFETRLIQFAGETIFFCKTLSTDGIGKYYSDQIIRSASGAALNYGEAQGCITTKDFIHKMSLVLKELKENLVSLKILEYVKYGEASKRKILLKEAGELAAISATMILNKKKIR